METAAQLNAKIENQRELIQNSNLPSAKKKELLKRLSLLSPQDDDQEHPSSCECGYCESGFASHDNDKELLDPAIMEVQNNFSNPIIPPKIMNSKVTAFVVLGVGIVLTIIGIKMLRKQKAAPTV